MSNYSTGSGWFSDEFNKTVLGEKNNKINKKIRYRIA